MSAKTRNSTTESETEPKADTPTKRDRLVTYLSNKAQQGERYFKSCNIANDLNFSSKEVGSLMGRLSEESAEYVTVEKWSYTSSTTWRVEPNA